MLTAANNPDNRSTEIAHQLCLIQAKIVTAAKNAGRDPADIELIAVSKTKPLSDIVAAQHAGHDTFGENYAQELHDKAEQQPADWHFIGPLQSNKTKLIANTAAWVHSIDRLKIAQRLSAQRDDHLPPLNVCIQVNISNEPQKAGIHYEAVKALAVAINELPRLSLRGLMCIPRADDQEAYPRMQTLASTLRQQGYMIDTLSMGMSRDFEHAIAFGATHVRVGTAIFGTRV